MKKQKQSVTIRDIAQACAVHPSTVSLALRHDNKVNPDTARDIREKAQRMGYRPNPLFAQMMSNMRAGKHPTAKETIAYITAPNEVAGWKQFHAYRAILNGAQERAGELNFGVDLFDSPTYSSKRLAGILRERGIRSIILSSYFRKQNLEKFPWDEFIAVQIEFHPFLRHFPCVGNDQTQAMREAIKRSFELGYRRVGVFIGNQFFDDRLNNTWMAGCLLAQRDLKPTERMFIYSDDGWSQEKFNQWMHREKPDIILAIDTYYTLEWLIQLGLKVPGDIAYAKMDLQPQDKGIAGIEQQHNAVGRTAVDILASRLYENRIGPDSYATTTRISSVWVDNTSAPARK